MRVRKLHFVNHERNSENLEKCFIKPVATLKSVMNLAIHVLIMILFDNLKVSFLLLKAESENIFM